MLMNQVGCYRSVCVVNITKLLLFIFVFSIYFPKYPGCYIMIDNYDYFVLLTQG